MKSARQQPGQLFWTKLLTALTAQNEHAKHELLTDLISSPIDASQKAYLQYKLNKDSTFVAVSKDAVVSDLCKEIKALIDANQNNLNVLKPVLQDFLTELVTTYSTCHIDTPVSFSQTIKSLIMANSGNTDLQLTALLQRVCPTSCLSSLDNAVKEQEQTALREGIYGALDDALQALAQKEKSLNLDAATKHLLSQTFGATWSLQGLYRYPSLQNFLRTTLLAQAAELQRAAEEYVVDANLHARMLRFNNNCPVEFGCMPESYPQVTDDTVAIYNYFCSQKRIALTKSDSTVIENLVTNANLPLFFRALALRDLGIYFNSRVKTLGWNGLFKMNLKQALQRLCEITTAELLDLQAHCYAIIATLEFEAALEKMGLTSQQCKNIVATIYLEETNKEFQKKLEDGVRALFQSASKNAELSMSLKLNYQASHVYYMAQECLNPSSASSLDDQSSYRNDVAFWVEVAKALLDPTQTEDRLLQLFHPRMFEYQRIYLQMKLAHVPMQSLTPLNCTLLWDSLRVATMDMTMGKTIGRFKNTYPPMLADILYAEMLNLMIAFPAYNMASLVSDHRRTDFITLAVARAIDTTTDRRVRIEAILQSICKQTLLGKCAKGLVNDSSFFSRHSADQHAVLRFFQALDNGLKVEDMELLSDTTKTALSTAFDTEEKCIILRSYPNLQKLIRPYCYSQPLALPKPGLVYGDDL